jgi:hypothetical protein
MKTTTAEQLSLDMSVREKREVYWFAVEQESKKRKFWFGDKVISTFVKDERGMPKQHKIDSDDIPKVKDEQLRTYLRLADAANAMGMINSYPDSENSGSYYHHGVHIEATDEGLESTFVSGYVDGNDDDLFVADLHTFAPKHEDN